MKFINWTPYSSQPMGGSSSSGGGGGGGYVQTGGGAPPRATSTAKKKEKKKYDSSTTLNIIKASEGSGLDTIQRNKVSDTVLTGLGKAVIGKDFKTDSNTYSFKNDQGGSHSTTIRNTNTGIPKIGEQTTFTVEKRKDAQGNITEIKGQTPTEFSKSVSGSGPDTTQTSTTSSSTASAPAEAQSTAPANVPQYDQAVEEQKVSNRLKKRRRGKRGLRTQRTSNAGVNTGTGGSGLSIPKG